MGSRDIAPATLALAALAALALLAAACEDDPPAAPEACAPAEVFPSAPDDVDAVLYVSAACPAGGADGSIAAPWPSIQAAIDAAPSGAAVVVAPGDYAENLTIATAGIRIIGSAAADDAELAGIILHAPEPHAVVVDGAADVTLRGLVVTSPEEVGIWVRGGGAATIEACRVEGARANGEGALGYGVLGTEAAGIILHHTTIDGADGFGVLLTESRGIILHNEISGAGLGGIRLERCRDAACGEAEASEIEDNLIEGNAGVGVAVFSSRAIILHNEVRGGVPGVEGLGDGVVVGSLAGADGSAQGAAWVDARDNIIEDNARAGFLLTGEVAGIILHNEVREQAHAGVWLQDGAGATGDVTIEDNRVSGNTLLGIALIGGARGIILHNEVRDTRAGTAFDDLGGSIAMGDGLGVLTGAGATVTGGTFGANARAAILVHAADGAATSVRDVTLEDNAHGVVVQEQDVAPTLEGQTPEQPTAPLSVLREADTGLAW